jgi:hypothetical protein
MHRVSRFAPEARLPSTRSCPQPAERLRSPADEASGRPGYSGGRSGRSPPPDESGRAGANRSATRATSPGRSPPRGRGRGRTPRACGRRGAAEAGRSAAAPRVKPPGPRGRDRRGATRARAYGEWDAAADVEVRPPPSEGGVPAARAMTGVGTIALGWDRGRRACFAPTGVAGGPVGYGMTLVEPCCAAHGAGCSHRRSPRPPGHEPEPFEPRVPMAAHPLADGASHRRGRASPLERGRRRDHARRRRHRRCGAAVPLRRARARIPG